MSDDELSALFRSAGTSGARRGWRCPDETVLVAWFEGRVAGPEREKLEAHVADCPWCRGQLGFLARASDLGPPPAVPPHLIAAARGERAPLLAGLRPATLVAAGAGLLLALLVASPWGRFPGASPAAVEQVRGATPAAEADGVPRLLAPAYGESLRRGALELRWAGTPDALFYVVEIVDADGDVAWEGRAEAVRLAVPPAAPLLPDRTYFARVTAHLRSGATVPSPAVGFHLAPG